MQIIFSYPPSDKYPDKDINAQKHSEVIKNVPIGASREQLIAEVTVLTELVRVLSDRVAELEVLNWVAELGDKHD
jgi:hypothetical protein